MPNSAPASADGAGSSGDSASLEPSAPLPLGGVLSALRVVVPEEGASWERELDTPRDQPASPASSSAPSSPGATRKSRPRAAWGRTNSLKDAKVRATSGACTGAGDLALAVGGAPPPSSVPHPLPPPPPTPRCCW